MSVAACIQFAPIFTAERMAEGARATDLYQRGSLRFLPSQSSVPLLVDHDKDREVGVVHELVEWENTDGPWFVARATVTEAPEWLERGSRASFGYANLERQEIGGWGRAAGAGRARGAHKSLAGGSGHLRLRRREPSLTWRADSSEHRPSVGCPMRIGAICRDFFFSGNLENPSSDIPPRRPFGEAIATARRLLLELVEEQT
jgi:hypothetical protein